MPLCRSSCPATPGRAGRSKPQGGELVNLRAPPPGPCRWPRTDRSRAPPQQGHGQAGPELPRR
eukprot:38856-Lingulodinium_polyedra.AAC.1